MKALLNCLYMTADEYGSGYGTLGMLYYIQRHTCGAGIRENAMVASDRL